MRLLGIAAVLLFLMPLAGGQIHPTGFDAPGIHNPTTSTPTHLWFHVFFNQDFPINTQEPPASFVRDDGIGLGANTLTCLPSTTPPPPVSQQPFSTHYGYLSPARVEYGLGQNGDPRVHPERGMGDDVHLDRSIAPTLDWYITTDHPIPNVVARATLRVGERITKGDEGYNGGALIAQGQTDPTTLAGAATFSGTPGSAHPQVTAEDQGNGQGFVYGFHVPLAYASTTIPWNEGFNVRIDLVIQTPACDISKDQAIMPSGVYTHTDATHRPGLAWSVLDPLRIESLHPQFQQAGDEHAVVFRASLGSPWGNYDVNTSTMEVLDPSGHAMQGPFPVTEVVHFSECCDTSVRPLQETFAWPFDRGTTPAGHYIARFQATNLQHTANATVTAGFDIGRHLQVTKCGEPLPRSGPRNATVDPSCRQEFEDESGVPLDPASLQSPTLEAAMTVTVVLAGAVLRRRRT